MRQFKGLTGPALGYWLGVAMDEAQANLTPARRAQLDRLYERTVRKLDAMTPRERAELEQFCPYPDVSSAMRK